VFLSGIRDIQISGFRIKDFRNNETLLEAVSDSNVAIKPSFASLLLRWYKKVGRDLPWRKTTDPYTIWVSEILLQQTQVATVLPYYHRFLAAFPAVHDLAAAPIDSLLKLWQGLGYYARARHLADAAKQVVNQYGGRVPSSYDTLISLPGIGRSTAGAILNIAFHQRHPILDGNVKRILIRLFLIQEKEGKKRDPLLWSFAEQILPRKQVDLFTQAIMDLGATVCLPKHPKCDLCPVVSHCQAYKKGWQDRLPAKPAPKKIPHHDYVAAVITKGESVFIQKRPSKGLLGGLWEFPGGKVERVTDFDRVMQEIIGQTIMEATPWFCLTHTFSHFKMTLHLFRGTVQRNISVPNGQWVPLNELKAYPFSATHQKVVVRLTKGE
jgi:A/G-specific adenine glycosylase